MHWHLRLTTGIIFLLVFLTPFYSATSSISDARLWTHFTIQNGLPDNRIRQVLEDADGSLLVVTVNSGIFRYDGVQFLPLPINQSLPTLFIQWVVKDNKDRLWIACNYQGIWIYDHGKLYPSEFNHLFNKQHFVTLFKDQQGDIWIDVNRVGLFRCYGQQCENMTAKFNLPAEDILQIVQQDSLTYLLLFSNWQIGEFAPQQSKPFKLLYSSSSGIDAFAPWKNRSISLREQNWNLTTIGTDKKILLLNDRSMSAGRSAFLIEAETGRVWFCASGNIHCYHSNQLESFEIGDATICYPFQDRFHNIWFATDIGLFKYSRSEVTGWYFPEASDIDLSKLGNIGSNKFMFQDRSGRLWFTDYDGQLLNFDGNRVAAFQLPDSLKSIRVTDIVQARNGQYWLGTFGNGVIEWDGKNFQRFISEKDLPGSYITSLCIDSKDRLWIGCTSALVHFSSSKTSALMDIPQSSQENFSDQVAVTSLTVDEQENVWLGTSNSTIFYSSPDRFRRIETTRPVANRYRNVQNLIGHDNALWGTSSYGIFSFDCENKTSQFFPPPTFTPAIDEPPLADQFNWITGDFYHTNSIYRLKAYQNFQQEPAIPIYNVSSTCQDTAGGVWIGSYSVGLFYIDADTLIRFGAKDGLTSLKIAAIYRDQFNRLWVGTLDHGLFQRQRQNFRQIHSMKAVGNSIYTFFEDRQGQLWIGTLDNGLVSFSDDEIHVYKKNLPHPSIWGISQSPAGFIYVALEDASFARFNGDRFEILSRNAILFDHELRQAFKNKTINFRSYFLAPEKYISSGLACWDGEQLKHFTVEQGLPGHEISDIAETADGKIWIATLNTGIAVIEDDQFHPLVQQDLNRLSRWLTLHPTADSALWLLSDEGMAIIKQDSIKIWDSSSKLVAFHARDIQTDLSNQLVFSDATSLYYFNGGDIQKLADLPNDQIFEQKIMPFFHIDYNNRAWLVSTERKLLSLQLQDVPPIIIIKNCQVGTEIYNESQFHQPIVRSYEDRACAIEFSGYHSSFIASQIKYSYRMIKAGKASDWSPFTTQNRILYSALVPGENHRFEIRAQTPNGLVSDRAAVLQINLSQQPFYLQSWFYWMVSSLILIAIALYFRNRYYRIRQIINQRRFNPYIAGEPILKSELFFGRDETVKKILSILHNNSVMITGERRIGKTSLLLQLKKQLTESHDPHYAFIPIFVDLQGVEQWEFFQALTHDLLEQAGDSVSSLPLKFQGQAADYGYRDFNSDFRAILRHVSAQHQRAVKLVLLIDEADAMNQYDQIIHAQLRRIFMQEFSLNFGAIIAGTNYIQSWNRPESPWWNLFTMIELKAFTEQDAQQLIQAPVKGIFKYTPEAITAIMEKSEAKPYAIQALCLNLVTRAFDKGRRKIGREDVLAVFENM